MRFGRSDDLAGAQFREADLTGARFVESDLSDVVIRGSELAHLEIDSPWLSDDGNVVLVNGIDVVPMVEAALDRRFPGRSRRQAEDPPGLIAAWSALERTWSATLQRVAGLPEGAVDVSVAGEWTFAETLRHLVMATDIWLGHAILGLEQPIHPIGKCYADADRHAIDLSMLTNEKPLYSEVLRVRTDRQAMVRDFIAGLTAEALGQPRTNPWSGRPQTVLSCLHVILKEEWEHHRYAVRDLDAIADSS